ncbi:WYL domain-containing protein [Gleimia sp. 6138-11-ORH1]|uniref:helix-turn-helix transcriptional regulator n=1 Tax=Gleimia sp. 6138-11-ORH1 TaxID=2973937 RepID=UPI002169968D|nr:WYL domain-containing protein [Gleimia sp. 6138-11-ORH1]MCS4484355.1 WYL domain-containing protein [Gleimia sp. 6138-11-ORH1]
MSEKFQADLRLVTLLLTLNSTPIGVSKKQIYERIPAYQEITEAARERMFERDKVTLKELGVELELVETKQDEPLYRVKTAGGGLRLDTLQRQVLDMAARLWSEAKDLQSDSQLFRYKVNAYAITDPAAVKAMIAGASLASALLAGIAAGQVVEFSYLKRAQTEPEIRRVLPTGLIFKDNVLYLEGIDQVREDSRTFRLSRFLPNSLRFLLGENASEKMQGVVSADGQPEEISPVLLVATDYEAQVAFWATELAAAELESLSLPGIAKSSTRWKYYRGYPASFSVWLERVLAAQTQLLVVEPEPLQVAVKASLEAALQWERGAGGN